MTFMKNSTECKEKWNPLEVPEWIKILRKLHEQVLAEKELEKMVKKLNSEVSSSEKP